MERSNFDKINYLANTTSSKTLVLFAAYSKLPELPAYVIQYLESFQPFAQQIILITNKNKWSVKTANWLHANNIQHLQVSNYGYDFGKYYKALQIITPSQYNRIIFANDSCIVVNSLHQYFDWWNTTNCDIAGLMCSLEKQYHIQSYFFGVQGKAIAETVAYFKKHKLFFSKRKVIKYYELGLTPYWLQQNCSVESFIDVRKIEPSFTKNPCYFLFDKIVSIGIPIVKRHLLMNTFGKAEKESLEKHHFILDANHYLQIIKRYNPTFEL